MPLVPPLSFSSPSHKSSNAGPTLGAPARQQQTIVPDNATDSSSAEGNELAFLEFVTCSICHYPLQSEHPRDFWITSCAHILCGSTEHQHKAQQCTYCSKSPIETFLVSDDLPEDLRRWLQPTRTSITNVSDSLSILYFQNRELSGLVRHLRQVNERNMNEVHRLRLIERELESTKRQLAVARSELHGRTPHGTSTRIFGIQQAGTMGPPSFNAPQFGTDSQGRKRLRSDDAGLPPFSPPKIGSFTTPLPQLHDTRQTSSVPQRNLKIDHANDERPSTSASIRKLAKYAYNPADTRSSTARPARSPPEIRHPQPQRAAPIRAMPIAPPTPNFTQTVRIGNNAGRLPGSNEHGRTIPLLQSHDTPRSRRTVPTLNGTPQRFIPSGVTGSTGAQSGFRRASEM